MTFKNFCFLAKKPEMYSRVGFFYADSYDDLLCFLGKSAVFWKSRIGKYESRTANDMTENKLKIILERIQFINKCKNNEF